MRTALGQQARGAMGADAAGAAEHYAPIRRDRIKLVRFRRRASGVTGRGAS